MKISRSLASLHAFLSKKETSGDTFTKEDILLATNWKEATFRTYWNKGQLADFISEASPNVYEASNCNDKSEVEFSKLLSQSKHRRGLGHNCKSKLAKALLSKSKDNMLLALELYNRPSLENRMDAFVMCFCTAWEQFLKAYLIERDGEASVFRKAGKKGLKETISLRECLEKAYPAQSNVRKNIEQVVYLRDQAVHLLMPEVQGIMSRVFQSGVLNFTSKFEEFTEVSFLNSSHAGMISLVGEFKLPPVAVMKSTYGSIADDILDLASTVRHDVEESDNIEFAIPLNVKLVFATDADDGTTVTIAKADEGMEGLKRALVIEKPVDRSKSHPLLRKDAIKEINDKLLERYEVEKLKVHLTSRCKKTGKPVINSNCFESVLAKNKWKNADNKYHYKNANPEYHYYSHALVEEFIKKVMDKEDYLTTAKKWFNSRK
ncbi:DUF3644 domain-containing protein [Vibrio albus]|jgi:hypothetical protein|uniref:DUF3644 domain-containing protein n=1 Tax=Vibrio albus TaxID=2200953 RepID=A0A2U3BBR0_9VIBR|nr:DUF3644 domain-containing protein [Vibrio albus]PWI34229.1 DUF3644 domain-containing protein [Vibrio albus]